MYDYFIKDHLGNTRVVLTEQTDFSQYLATMEQPKAQKEEALFYNLNSTRTLKPVDYPQDNITTPNQAVARLNGGDPNKRIGPSIILKVMAGDTLQAAVRAYYKQQAEPRKKISIPAEQMLAGLLQALVAPGAQAMATHGGRLAPGAEITGSGLTANDLQSLWQKNPDNKEINKPKAYLNYVFFDKQLNFVEEGSGVKQVDGEAGKLEILSSGKVVAKENGYVYVFTSNESQQPVFFDNLGVMQITGPVLEETHYYPFGLTMSGISAQAFGGIENKYRYNGKELQDELGLNWYDYGARMYDEQIGRWTSIDALANKMPAYSPYSYAFDNPVKFIDVQGKYPIYVLTRSYAPYATFGPNDRWYGDNRGATLNRGSSYRSLVSINYDTETRLTTAFGGRTRSHTTDGRQNAVSTTVVFNRSKGNNIDVHSAGRNEAQFGSFDIDQFTKLKVTTEGSMKSNHVLNISGTISGDDFPNQESMVYDSKGNGLWLGNYETKGDRESAPVTDLPFENEGDVQINVNIRIKVNKKGVFQGVMINENGKDKMISIDDWNKRFKSDDNK